MGRCTSLCSPQVFLYLWLINASLNVFIVTAKTDSKMMVEIVKHTYPRLMLTTERDRSLFTLDGVGQHMAVDFVRKMAANSTDVYVSPPNVTPLIQVQLTNVLFIVRLFLQVCDHPLINKQIKAGVCKRYCEWMSVQLEQLQDHETPKAPERKIVAKWVSEAYWSDVSDADIATGL